MRTLSHALLTFSLLAFLIVPSQANGEIYHKVKAGERLSQIAKKYHVSVASIQNSNELRDYNIRTGQRLLILVDSSKPGKKSKGRQATRGEVLGSESPPQEIPDGHIVVKGETLTSIAHLYGLRVWDLRRTNDLRGGKLKPGQILRLRETEDLGGTEPDRKGPGRDELETAAAPTEPAGNGDGFFKEEKDRQLLVRAAKTFLGAKYRLGGSSINGMDCSAFVQKVFRIFAVDLPRTVAEQFRTGYEVSRNSLRTGDLLFFTRSTSRTPTHVGIYIGNNQFIHTSSNRQRVEIGSLNNRYFDLRFLGAKRIEDAGKGKDMEEPGG